MCAVDPFPPIILRPVLNQDNAWVALSLEGEGPFNEAELAFIIEECGLGEILERLPCLVRGDASLIEGGLLGRWPDDRVRLHAGGAEESLPAGWTIQQASGSHTGKGDPTVRSLLLRLLSAVTGDVDTARIEALVKQDASLAFKLIRMVNSVAFAPDKRIDCLSQAILMLGRRQLQRWVSLLLFAQSAGGGAGNPLLGRAAIRAHLLEGLVLRAGLGRETQDQAFMVGMFSLLDRLLDMPLAEIIAPLHLHDCVSGALLAHQGGLGRLLTLAEAGDRPPGPALSAALADAGLTATDWAASLSAAIVWAERLSRES